MSPDQADSPIVDLRAIRDRIADKQKLSLRVQRWDDPEILITYKPLDGRSYSESMQAVFDADPKKPVELAEVSLNSNMDVLIRCCIDIHLKGSEVDHHFDGFGVELCKALEIDEPSARAACHGLFVVEGDINAHANKIVEFSGYRQREIDETFSGE